MAASMASARGVRVLSKIVRGHSLPGAAVQLRAVCPRSLHSPGSSAPSPDVTGGVSPLIAVTEEPDALHQRLSVKVKGHDKAVLDSYEFFATLAARELGLQLDRVFEPPKHIDKLTLLKSVHIFKKHRVQYEMRTHYRCIEISRITGSSARVYLEYIQRNLPEGVAMEVTKTAMEKIPEHIQTPMWDDSS